jgi:FGGY-family pentulose kinase
MGEFVVAVDVGTGSARAGIYDRLGTLLARAAHPIVMNREDAVFAEHSSTDIWNATTACVRDAVAMSGIDPAKIDAIGFDATCSLTFLDRAGSSISVARSGETHWDTIAWLDHRAVAQARALTNSGAESLKYSGGIVSPEMQLPKIMSVRDMLWPDQWRNVALILDLADFLTFRATGKLARSASTLVAKWNYLGHETSGWDDRLLREGGLEQLREKAGIDEPPVPSGSAIGTLSPEAAAAFGLPQGCKVAAGMVDAYAGTLALAGTDPEAADCVSLIGGTSTCVMRFSREPQFVPAFWGPYFGAALPDYWISEGGQSAAGALLDHILRIHLGRPPATVDHEDVLARISDGLASMGQDFGHRIHVLPDFHGNRTPFGDASMLGSIHGLSLDSSPDGLAALYYRTMVALALGMRQTIERMEKGRIPIRRLILGGGHAKSALFAQLYADAIGRDVVIAAGEEAMLLGTAMTAASAAGWYGSLKHACQAMQRRTETIIHPNPANRSAFESDYRILLKMQEHRAEIAALSLS